MKANLKIVLSGIFVVVVIIGCQKAGEIIKENVQTPKVSLADLAVTDISSQKLNLLAKLEIDNPNPIGLSLDGLDYNLELAGNSFFSGESNEGLNVKASGKSFAKVPIALKYDDLKKVYDSLKNEDEVPYRLSGQVKLNTPIGSLPIPYDVKGKLPVVRPPKINSVDLKVKSLTLSEAKLDLNLKLFNPNSFPLNISRLNYQLLMDGKDFSNGQIESAKVPAKSEGEIAIPILLDLAGVGNWAYSLLKSGSSDYELDYDAKYQIKDWPVKHQEKKTGTLKIKK